jgi:hypothetical protein
VESNEAAEPSGGGGNNAGQIKMYPQPQIEPIEATQAVLGEDVIGHSHDDFVVKAS